MIWRPGSAWSLAIEGVADDEGERVATISMFSSSSFSGSDEEFSSFLSRARRYAARELSSPAIA
jgi:hypothetical protein